MEEPGFSRIAPAETDSAAFLCLEDLLADGGDERIEIDPASGRNRYGGAVRPEPGDVAFSSSTISTISAEGFAAASERLEALQIEGDATETYARGTDRIRARLTELCGLPASCADDVILGASGTDLHLIAASLARGDPQAPLTTILGDPVESGRGVPLALSGRRYSARPPHGTAGLQGEPLPDLAAGELIAIRLRDADGAARDPAEIDKEAADACERAIAERRKAMLVVLDVSKTGLIAPTPDCAARLKARHGAALTVLVDACQFRLSTESLAWCLDQDFMVAVTGSKFFGGPPFSGALFVPPRSAGRVRERRVADSLGEFSAAADWPARYAARRNLPDVPNWGLLLRWEAALHEMGAFRGLPVAKVEAFLRDFAGEIDAQLAALPELERIEAPAVRRIAEGWDSQPTIFPFLVHGRAGPLGAEATQALYEQLRTAPAPGRVALGQPVPVGVRGGRAVSALRLSLGAREIVEALTSPGGRDAVTARALHALEVVAQTVRAGG